MKLHQTCKFVNATVFKSNFSTYDFLREHFRNEHYLCEEGDCYNEKFTAVFRTDIDLKGKAILIKKKRLRLLVYWRFV